MAAPRFQELEHPFVRPARLGGQGERHEVLQVEVVDADGVGIAESAKRDLGRGPDADARDRLEHRRGGYAHIESRPGEIREPLEAGSLPGGAADDVGPALLHPERMEHVVGERGQGLGPWLEPESMGCRDGTGG